MSVQTPAEKKLARALIEVLGLEDIEAGDIAPEARLFGYDTPDSLGLDSIDALEISLMVSQRYGVQIKAEDEKNKAIFACLRSLSAHIEKK
jgi:acyl carrier protein